MEIFDKASWQIDGGIEADIVVAHFERMFKWLDGKNMLTAAGKEIFESGIDDNVSLHDRLVTPEAAAFLLASYDDYIDRCLYEDDDLSVLETVYKDYLGR